jgi:hypothetical protein
VSSQTTNIRRQIPHQEKTPPTQPPIPPPLPPLGHPMQRDVFETEEEEEVEEEEHVVLVMVVMVREIVWRLGGWVRGMV